MRRADVCRAIPRPAAADLESARSESMGYPKWLGRESSFEIGPRYKPRSRLSRPFDSARAARRSSPSCRAASIKPATAPSPDTSNAIAQPHIERIGPRWSSRLETTGSLRPVPDGHGWKQPAASVTRLEARSPVARALGFLEGL